MGPMGQGGPMMGDVLRRRYASGEITREQYEEARQTLEPTRP